jgi:Phosphotransferase enzyme family
MTITDEFNAASDPALPTVSPALDPERIESEFKHGLPRLAGEHGRVKVKAARVIRYKAGRRCVIEYDVRIKRPNAEPERLKLIGKIRAKRFGNEGYRLLNAIWEAGFSEESADGISVPEPLGVLTGLRMWLQRKVNGAEAMAILTETDNGVELARRIAAAAHKLHQAGVPAERSHTMSEELQILHEHLPLVLRARPHLQKRIERVLAGCDRLGERLARAQFCGIHRDFYAAQVIVGKGRLYLVDFDLYCMGDPALDIGNFLGHLTEAGIRCSGNSAAYAETEQALEAEFLRLSGEHRRNAVEGYALLTLARHIYISSLFADRASATEKILCACEERFQKLGFL